MDFAGKQTDVIDSGGEADYANMQWFQEPAPQRTQVCLACSGSLLLSLFAKHTC